MKDREGEVPLDRTRSAPVVGEIPRKLPNYEILSLIGKGGMGEVYLAHDERLDRKVAIKFLPEEMVADPQARKRFLREAKAAAALDHPFICKIFEAGEYEGQSYIVMEYIPGTTLRDKIAETPLGLGDALKVALEVAEALEAAHEKGIAHRDLKPSNLMCTPQGHVKVMDFGLAKHVVSEPDAGALTRTQAETATAAATVASVTESGVVVGTIAYMSPEQAKGGEVDTRTDIFALGIVLAEILTGRHPFNRPTPVETLTAVLRDNPPPIHIKPKVINPALSRILHKALAKEPAERYQKISEMAADIRALESEIAPGGRHGLRGWGVRGLALAGVIAIAALAWILVSGREGGSSPPSGPPPIKVLVADFENTTGDSVFDGALEQTFAIGLEGASFITVYDHAQAREEAGGGALDREKSLLVSRREGINVVVCGSIQRAGNGSGFTIRMEALDPVTSKTMTRASESIRTKSEVLRAADSLAARLRTDLGGAPQASARALSMETFTAASVEAMNAYSKAQEFTTMGHDEEAIEEYLKAVAFDPKMGRAYAGLATAYRNRGQIGEARRYYEKAMPLLGQMTEREKFRTRGGYYFVNRNFNKAIEEYEALLKQFPMDLAGHINLPLAHFYARDMPRAFEEGQKAVAVFPGKVNPLYNFIWYAIAAGKLEEAEAALPKVMTLNPGFSEARVCLALVRLLQGRDAEARAEYEKLRGSDPYASSLAAAGLADLALYEGRPDEARDILGDAIRTDLANGLKAFAYQKRLELAAVLAARGLGDEGMKAAEDSLAGNPDESLLFQAALVEIEAGKEDQALALAAQLETEPLPEPQAYSRLIQGEVELREGALAKAIKTFHEAQAQVDTWIGRVALGRAYLAAGQFTEAHSEFETCLKRRGEAASVFLDDLPTMRYLPQVYYYMGRAQEGLGIPAARESYGKFLEIKSGAKGDPLVEDAKRRLRG